MRSFPLVRSEGFPSRTNDPTRSPAVTDSQKKKRKQIPWLSSSSSGRHALQCRCQTTPTQPTHNADSKPVGVRMDGREHCPASMQCHLHYRMVRYIIEYLDILVTSLASNRTSCRAYMFFSRSFLGCSSCEYNRACVGLGEKTERTMGVRRYER